MSSLDNIYKDYLNHDLFGSHSYNDEFASSQEEEDFITSKEIVKMKECPEGNPNIPIPAGKVDIEEEFGHFKRYTTRREHKYTESEMTQIRESCRRTIVHDYSENDSYHQSDEERARNDSLRELSLQLSALHRTYRKVDEYIIAMRTVVAAWELLEKKENYLHSTDEFFELVSEGRIYSKKIIMPKLKGIDKFNIDTIIRYISNPDLNPKDLVPVKEQSKRDSWYDQFREDDEMEDIETEEEEMARLLSPEEAQFIMDNEDNPPEIKVKELKYKYVKGYDRRGFGSRLKKNKKKGNKKDRYTTESVHDILNKIQSNPNNREDGNSNRSYLVTNSMFEREREEKDFWEDMRFEGSWADDDANFLYDLALREELLKQKTPGNSYTSYADREVSQFFKILEDNNVNVVELRRLMNMTTNDLQSAESKRKKKENRKIESAILQRITKLNESDKFKKLAEKAEKAINNQMKDY